MPNDSEVGGGDGQNDGRPYSIGYGKPPPSGQFLPGQSGNPKGRKKGTKTLRIDLDEELKELVSITENGKSRKISKQRLMLKSLVAGAAKGNVSATDKLLNLMIQTFGYADERDQRTKLSDNDQRTLDAFLADSDGDKFSTEQPAGDGGESELDSITSKSKHGADNE